MALLLRVQMDPLVAPVVTAVRELFQPFREAAWHTQVAVAVANIVQRQALVA